MESDSEGLYDEELITGIKCVCYQFDVLIKNITSITNEYEVANLETRLLRLKQHFAHMHDNITYVFVISDRIKTYKMNELLTRIYLKQSFDADDVQCVIGSDHEWVSDCKKSLQSMMLRLINKLQIENEELLFIGNKRGIRLIETINVCQTYNVDHQGHHDNDHEVCNGTLKGRHLMFLESQILAGI